MKQIFVIILMLSLFSCNKEDSVDNNNKEDKEEILTIDERNDKEILAYIEENNLNAIKTESGVYVVTGTQGYGDFVDKYSTVTVAYNSYLLDGKILEQTGIDGVSFELKNVMQGLSEGIKYFKDGGNGKIIIPSRLAYGYDDVEDVPGGSVLVFDINMLNITTDFETKNEDEIIAYIERNNLNAKKTDSGLYYVVEKEGTGDYPDLDSEILIEYNLSIINDDVLLNSTRQKMALSSITLSGLSEGLQLLKEEGKVKLLIPSRLAFGSKEYSDLAANSVIICDVELFSIGGSFDDVNEKEILVYIEKNNLSAIKTESGLYYVMEEEGTGEFPDINSTVIIDYSMLKINDEVLVEATEYEMAVNKGMTGLKEGLQLLKVGGKGKFLIPSRLAFGSKVYTDLAAYSVIIFDVNLLSIINTSSTSAAKQSNNVVGVAPFNIQNNYTLSSKKVLSNSIQSLLLK